MFRACRARAQNVMWTGTVFHRGGSLGAGPAAYQANLAAVVGYVLKGASSDVQRAMGLERLEAGGRIMGKRAATSQNIGQAARQRSLK